jgi:hypothetical protein
MKSLLYSCIFLVATLSLSAQDKVYMIAGYHYEGKITSVTDKKVIMRRINNKVATINKSDIWKLVYENGKEVILNESNEAIEERIGKINDQETLEEIIRNGKDREVEVAYYNLIRRGYQYELREKNLSDFFARFPDSKYRRELVTMARFKRKLKGSKEVEFKCTEPYTPEVADRKVNLHLQFTEQGGAAHTLEVEAILKFIRTYGKKYKLNEVSEWKNEYEISMVLDDSTDPVEFRDQYKLVDDKGSPHNIFLSNVVFGKFNVNGKVEIGTNIRNDDGEYLINIDLQVDYLKW